MAAAEIQISAVILTQLGEMPFIGLNIDSTYL